MMAAISEAERAFTKAPLRGKRLAVARGCVQALILGAVLASLAFDSGIGTPSAFGAGPFFLLCPLGGIEAMLASRSFIPVSAISLAVVLGFSLLFGRAWCAWGCPAPAIRRFFRRDAPAARSVEREGSAPGDCPALAAGARGLVASARAQASWNAAGGLRHALRDPRSWVLAGVLAATLAVGLPVFCLVCPIGLTFGTVGSLWHLIVDKQVTASVFAFPTALALELVLYRRWCANVCPIAGLLGLVGQFARGFRPSIEASSCLHCTGRSACHACSEACPEGIDLHAPDAAFELGECTRCGECLRACPTASIAIGATASDPIRRAG